MNVNKAFVKMIKTCLVIHIALDFDIAILT